jgi:hypothetical protein
MSSCVVRAGGTMTDLGLGIAANGQGGVFAVGSFTGSMQFTLPRGTYFANSAGGEDSYYMLVDSSCNIVNVGNGGGSQSDAVRSE